MIPYGYCQCGCGQKTNLTPDNNKTKGMVKGEPRKYLHNHHPMKRNLVSDYKVNPDTGCWEWEHSLTTHGYAQFRQDGKDITAHRHYYEKHKGLIPAGLILDHLCRNRACVNPDHLEIVTVKVNNRRGAATKLTVEKVSDIRSLRQQGMKKIELREKFSVSLSHLNRILRNEVWV